MIKLLIFLTFAAVVCSRKIDRNAALNWVNECLEEVNIEGLTLDSLRELKKTGTIINPEWNCFYKCINQKMRLVDVNGALSARDYVVFLSEQVGEVVEESEIQEQVAILNTCANADIADLCQRSVKIAQCVEREWLDKP